MLNQLMQGMQDAGATSILAPSGDNYYDWLDTSRVSDLRNGVIMAEPDAIFDGTDDAIEFTQNTDYDITSDWSLEFTVIIRTGGSTSGTIINVGDTNSGQNGAIIRIGSQHATPYVFGRVRNNLDTTEFRTPNSILTYDKKHHILISYTSNTLTCYIDGSDETGVVTFTTNYASLELRVGYSGGNPLKGNLGPLAFHKNTAQPQSYAQSQTLLVDTRPSYA